MKVIILGSGGSCGVPEIGCECKACVSTNHKNKRRRASIYIEVNGVNILIDTSPDLLMQSLDNKLKHLDAVLYTHAHADHLAGIDDLKSFSILANQAIPAYGSESTINEILRRFHYMFIDPLDVNSKCNTRGRTFPFVSANIITPGELFSIKEVEILGVMQTHGKGESIGYRIGNVAYSPDFNILSDETIKQLSGLDLWIVDCLGYGNYPAHIGLDEALYYIERVKPKRAILTHMSHEIEYTELLAKLPKNVTPAFDNMVVEVI